MTPFQHTAGAIKACPSRTWPLQCGPAPMPIVGIESSRVAAAATSGGTHSSTIAKQPASCRACVCTTE